MKHRGLLFVAVVLCACSSDPEDDDGSDGSSRDGSSNRDASVSRDSEPGGDVAGMLDASVNPDAASMGDAETAPDRTPPMDAEPAADRGPPDMGTTPNDGGVTANARMSFFVTSVGNGANGGNYGGLTGADARCQALAASVGAGQKTWHAYLSVSGGNGPTVHARDRIGSGPWYNFDGMEVGSNVTAIHSDGISYTLMQTEIGTRPPQNEHDILTGSQTDGTAWTSFPGNPAAAPPNCGNWTSSSDGDYAFVGHVDWDDPNTGGNPHWISSHDTRCSEQGLRSTAGTGRLYCFAID
jgi:hypothetical protein